MSLMKKKSSLKTKNRVSFSLILVLILIASFQNSISQTLKIVPPTPSAMKMTEYQAQRPNLYTGTANVAIQLHTINFDGWELPINISYNATGIRTGEEASEVGLGWSLTATGVISRTVRGFDDFYPGGVGDGRGRGYVYNTTPLPEPFNLGYSQFTTRFPPIGSYYYYLNTSRPDTDPDVFNYNFFGYSGQFILSQKEKNSIPFPNKKISVIKLTQDASSIIFNEAEMTFTVITPTGYKGEFTAKERSTSLAGTREASNKNLACGEDKINFVYLQNQSGQFRVITSWYLTKIISPHDKEIIFKYELDSLGNSYYISNERSYGEDEQSNQNPLCLHNIHEHVYLKDITYKDNIKLEFAMEEREDLRRNVLFDSSSIAVRLFHYAGNLKRYTGIHITGMNGSTLNKNIIFSQTYFNEQYHQKLSNDESEWTWLRSRLDEVTIDDQKYRFNYYKGANGVPNKQTHAVDHFGFYNGQDLNDHLLWPSVVEGVNDGLCDLASKAKFQYVPNQRRLPDFDYAQAGLLRRVIYPTTGYAIYEYEGHSYMPDTSGFIIEQPGLKKAGGARIKAIKEYDYTNSLLRQRSYRYSELGEVYLTNGLPSTGRLMTPLLNLGKAARFIKDDPSYGAIDPNSCNFIVESNSSIPGNNAAEGKIIGYSVVHEIVEGESSSYKNSYFFENTPNVILKTLLAVESSANLNGHTKQTRHRNSDGKVIQVTIDSLYDDTSLTPLQGITYRAADWATEHLWYYQDHKIRRTFVAPTITKTITAATPSGVVEDSKTGDILTYGSVTKTQKKLVYKNYQLSSEETVNSNGDILKTEYKRPLDYPTPGGALPYMVDKKHNIIEPVIEEISYKNGAVIAAKANLYGIPGRFNLMSSYTYNPTLGPFTFTPSSEVFIAPYEKKLEYTGFDTDGNVLEYKTQDGVINSFIWGYKNTLPIVNGIGITNSQLKQAYTETVGMSNYETALRNHPNLAGKLVTTFTHNPQVGLLKITDPAGLKKTFTYDAFNRLKKVSDNNDNILQQYQYHFRERQPKRIVSLSGNLNFGTLTPDMYAPQSLEYIKCSESLKSKILTISNTGEDNLKIYYITLPPGFKSKWNGALIPPDESVDVIITFDNTVSLGNYNGNISIASDQTAGPSSIIASAIYANRTCGFTVPATFDFGVAAGGIYNNPLPIINSGNAPVELIAAPVNWNDIGTDYWNFTSPDFSVVTNFSAGVDPTQVRHALYCIAPGQTFHMPVNFTPQPGQYNGVKTAKLSLITDTDPAVCQWSFKDLLTIKADYQRPVSIISMDTNLIDFVAFTEASKPQTITISNTGTLGFTFSGLGFSNSSVASYFTVTPSNVVIRPGTSLNVLLTFQPPVFGRVTTDIIFQNDAMIGNETVAFTGNRYSYRKLVLTPSSGELIYDYTGQPKTMTITNQGNDSFTVTGVTPNANVQGFSISPINSTTLIPGQSMNITVMRVSNPSPDQTLTILANNNDGPTTFNIKTVTRTINYSDNPLVFASFSAASVTKTFTVSNSGSATLNVSNITSSNGNFSASPTSFLIASGGSQTVTATYIPTDFNLQTSTFSVSSDATNTGGNTIGVSAQRYSSRKLVLTPSSGELIYDYTGQPKTMTITNQGNDSFTVTGVTPNANVQGFSISPINSTTLIPGQSMDITVMRVSNPSPDQTLTIQATNNEGPTTFNIKTVSRIINYSDNPMVFASFSTASVTKTFTVSNSGSATLNVSNITSSNGNFSISPTSFLIASGGSQTVTATYIPTDFTSQTSTFSVNSDATNTSANSISVSAQRTQVKQVNFSTTSVYLKPSTGAQTVYVTNTGNMDVTINFPGMSDPSSAFVIQYNSGSISFPYILNPGSTMTINVSTSGGYNSANGSLSVPTDASGGTYIISLAMSSF